MIYLDWAATAPVYEDIPARLQEISTDYYGNPSSIHFAGRKANQLLTNARETIAAFAGCKPEELIFTSGASESNNMVIFSLLKRYFQEDSASRIKRKIIITGIEHPSVYEPALCLKKMGFTVKIITAEETGIIDPGAIARELDKDTVLVMMMHVNNETGAIQPVKEVSRIIKEYTEQPGRKILLHTDAVQAFGKIDFNFADLGVDSAAVSAHKIQGLKGVGALIVRSRSGYDFLYKGGDQENNRRPGTENLLGIHCFGLAACNTRERFAIHYAKARGLMDLCCNLLKTIEGIVFIPGARKAGNYADYSPYIIKAAFPPIPGEVLVRVLEDNGILVATGSACSSDNRPKMLRVLINMKVPELIAHSSIRVSIGPGTTESDIEALYRVLNNEVPKLRKMAG